MDMRARAPSFTGTTVTGTNTLIVISITQGVIKIGQPVPPILGIPVDTTISGFLTGIGGIGTYTLSKTTGLGAGTGLISITL